MALKLTYWTLTLMFFVALTFSFEGHAYAYVDPGSSLLLFQSVSTVATGVLFYFRRRIKRLFTRTPVKPAQQPAIPVLARKQ
ncbi:hypothetical protein [Granulicella tundricola]|uniref:Uncharacterized protein n=1 Tax=Granulicella tundricola (strain ATCC BAA-1859 / DSM 23138 / MP5ACTX9) TaxID=1198114 RepID=E8WZ95_GRATM|nr:hypothetical protein [Granulicella tundricola]ADW67697.1 hypothetical protein AciX9_0626 [Granulicella tundricola MP5ACTX9]